MGNAEQVMSVRLLRGIEKAECERRNALSEKPQDYVLQPGQVGVILETLEDGGAYLIEFGQRDSDACDWLGVLYASEIELQPGVAVAA